MSGRRVVGKVPCAAALLCAVLLCLATQPALAASVAVGTAPAGLALNPSTGLLYVANAGDSTVSIIDTASQSVVGLVALHGTVALGGSAAPDGVGVDLSANLVFVAESGAKQVALIDGTTGTLRSTVPVAVGPWGIAVNQTTNRVYVSGLADTLTVLDGTNGVVLTVVQDSRLQRPLGVAVDETRNRVYVANHDGNSVAVLDGNTTTVTTTVAVGSQPAAVAVDPGSGAVYVANAGANTLSVIDPAALVVSRSLSVGTGPVAVAVDPTAGVVYAAADDGTVTAVAESTATVLQTLTDPTLSAPQGLAIAAGGAVLYASSGGGNGVTVLPAVSTPAVAPPAAS